MPKIYLTEHERRSAAKLAKEKKEQQKERQFTITFSFSEHSIAKEAKDVYKNNQKEFTTRIKKAILKTAKELS